MVAVPKFAPIGEVLTIEDSFLQASRMLDAAGMIAQKHDDVEGMLNTAALYIELADKMVAAVSGDEDVDHEALARKQPLGYAPCPPPIIVPTEIEDETDERIDREAEEEARSNVQSHRNQQLGQLRVKQGYRRSRVRGRRRP